MNTRSTIVRNTLFSSVGIYTEYFLGMLTSIIIARHLGPADFGTYSLVIWLVATGVVITNAGVSSSVIKFVAELRGAGRDGQIRSLLAWAWRVQATFMRSEEHTSELQSLMRISYAVFCLKKKMNIPQQTL